MMIRAAVLIALLTLTGCGQRPDSMGNAAAPGSTTSANPPPTGQTGANPAQDMIVDMTIVDRNHMFERFMRSGGDCGAPERFSLPER
jgi:hypothetical protein